MWTDLYASWVRCAIVITDTYSMASPDLYYFIFRPKFDLAEFDNESIELIFATSKGDAMTKALELSTKKKAHTGQNYDVKLRSMLPAETLEAHVIDMYGVSFMEPVKCSSALRYSTLQYSDLLTSAEKRTINRVANRIEDSFFLKIENYASKTNA